MRPELFVIPWLNISVKSYGFMMVLGFISAVYLARWLCRREGQNPEHITNFGVYALLAGVIGARLFHVFHNWPDYKDNLGEVFAIWSGGLEFLGGVVAAMAVMLIYFKSKKLPVLEFLDILAPALMLGLAFGRMGCFLNGCCFGGPCEVPWGIRFPAVHHMNHGGFGGKKEFVPQYSYPYEYQIYPDAQRRPGKGPILQLPEDYCDGFTDGKRHWVARRSEIPAGEAYFPAPKPPVELTAEQIRDLKEGKYPMHPIHPAQLYSVANALVLSLLLYLLFAYWRKYYGQVFGAMLVLYGIMRFYLESLRTDSPLEFDGLTISQNLSIIAVIGGIFMLWKCRKHVAAKKMAQGGKAK